MFSVLNKVDTYFAQRLISIGLCLITVVRYTVFMSVTLRLERNQRHQKMIFYVADHQFGIEGADHIAPKNQLLTTPLPYHTYGKDLNPAVHDKHFFP